MYMDDSEIYQSIDFEPYATTQPLSQSCSQGHRSSLILQTQEGGSICLVCLSNLISNPSSPTVHVSYALSQLSQAISQPVFLRDLLTFHPHFLVSPLVQALSSFDDEAIARQVFDLVSGLCNSGHESVHSELVARVADRLSSGALGWSRRQLFTLHCLGVLLDCQSSNPYSFISNKDALVFNLVTALQLPSEEIQGEIFFLLYKLSNLQYSQMDSDGPDVFYPICSKLVHSSLEVLVKTQSDDVRLNCLALLTVLAQRGFLEDVCGNDLGSRSACGTDSHMQTTEHVTDGTALNVLFAEAMKAPLLSADNDVQVRTLDLIFLYLSWEGGSCNKIQVLVEENIADYVFEILRLSGYKDPLVTSCLQVLGLLSTAQQTFSQRLTLGFSTLVPVLHYVAEFPFHPVQNQTLNLIHSCVSNCPGIASTTYIEEIGLELALMLRKYTDGDMGMLSDTFSMTCSTLVAIMKSPSSHAASNLSASIQDSSRHAIQSCLKFHAKDQFQLMHSLHLLKEAYSYSQEENPTSPSNMALRNCILAICKTTLFPWFLTAINDIEEEDIVLGVLETFHSIMLLNHDIQATEFVNVLVSSSWFSFSFRCLGLFPTEKMKWRIYLMLSSIVDMLVGNDFGHPIRNAASDLPSDPIDLLFLLGQKSSDSLELISSQSAVLLILYVSSLYDDRIADDKLVLSSLEQYILVNRYDFLDGNIDSAPTELLVNLYSQYRALAKIGYQIPYSPEAERILFHVVNEKELDLICGRKHPIALKWLFQQEKICKPLSSQILRWSRCINSYGNRVIMQGGSNKTIDVETMAKLVSTEDNFAAALLVYLLKELVEEGAMEDDIISVVSTLTEIVDTSQAASDQLCLHGIGSAIQSLCYRSRHSYSQMFMATCKLTLSVLHSVHSVSLSEDEAWVAIAMKIIDCLVAGVAEDGWTEGSLLVAGTLSLILYHSTSHVLVETSKTIFLNTPLVSLVKKTIDAACSKGSALFDHDEETRSGESLLFVLSLHFFSLQSVCAVLPGTIDAQVFLDQASGSQPLPFISTRCHDLCRMMHFGSSLVKLVASYSLVELFTIISDQINGKSDKLNSTIGYLSSVVAVLEGQVFCTDIRVAMNCSLCLSLIMGWEKVGVNLPVYRRASWCRLIVEELAMSLAVPNLASKSFTIHHKPAIHVAVALLKLQKVPDWMRTVFDDCCIRGIIGNISASNISTELVILFRELMNASFLKPEHIANLNRVFQACRKHLYTTDTQNTPEEELTEKAITSPHDRRKLRQVLINFMSKQTSADVGSDRSLLRDTRLLEELELFSKSLMEEVVR